MAVITATTAAQRRRTAMAGSSACFHFAMIPMPIRNIAGDIVTTNMSSKYGAPTESFPRFIASRNSG